MASPSLPTTSTTSTISLTSALYIASIKCIIAQNKYAMLAQWLGVHNFIPPKDRFVPMQLPTKLLPVLLEKHEPRLACMLLDEAVRRAENYLTTENLHEVIDYIDKELVV